MKFDFPAAITKALEGSNLDEQVQADVEALIERQKAAALRAAPEGKEPKPAAPHTDEQVQAIATEAIRAKGLIGLIEAALVAECVRAARPAPAESEAVPQ